MHAMYPVAVHIFLVKDGRILLMRRHNTGYEDENFSVVAGHIEHGESAKDACIREIREELGIQVNGESLKFIGAMFRKSIDERIDLFLTTNNWLGEPSIKEPNKCNLVVWADMTNLPRNTILYIRKAIENFLAPSADTWIQEFGWDKASTPSEKPVVVS